jgi:hypothetical protein
MDASPETTTIAGHNRVTYNRKKSKPCYKVHVSLLACQFVLVCAQMIRNSLVACSCSPIDSQAARITKRPACTCKAFLALPLSCCLCVCPCLFPAFMRAIHPPRRQHSTAQHSTAQHSTAQHSTAQHNTTQQLHTERPFAQVLFSRDVGSTIF